MWSCKEALTFGRKAIQVTVLRLGWNPQASTPSFVDRIFRRRERAKVEVPPPAAPPPAAIEPAVEETTGEDESPSALSDPASSAFVP